MFEILVFGIIFLVVALMLLNVYFRVKVFKSYKIMVQNRIEFKTSDLLSEQKLRSEVIPKYPKFENEILTFSRHIKRSITLVSIVLLLILVFGFVLVKYK